MGDVMKKFIAVLLYLFLMTIFLGFDIRKLVDFKQLFLVAAGACILYLPSIEVKNLKKLDKNLIGQNALCASIIQTFMLFFIMLVNGSNIDDRLFNIALSCRPLFYGFCIWIILHNEEQEKRQPEEVQIDEILLEEIQKIKVLQEKEEIQYKDIQQETGEYNNRNIAANILPGIEECRQQFLQAGLTRREAEVALLVIKHMSNAEIANELYISETTVKKHVSNIFSKLDISKREQIKDIIS